MLDYSLQPLMRVRKGSLLNGNNALCCGKSTGTAPV